MSANTHPISSPDSAPHAAPPTAARLDVLLVDDDPDIRSMVESLLREQGHSVAVARDGAEAMRSLDQRRYDLAICDVRLPKVDGMQLFRRIRQDAPDSQVILMSAYGTVSEAVGAMREKAAHYLAKPFDLAALTSLVGEIAEQQQLRRALEGHPDGPLDDETAIVGSSPAIQELRRKVKAIAKSDVAVLITGENGSGKELIVRLLHRASERATGPLVSVNCAAFPDTLLEAELFGHEKGAFTGAVSKRDGRFRAADGGTLFLDEVAEMSLSAQAKLLRVLEDGSFQPIGSNTTVRADVRLVSATNVDVRAAVVAGRFREDIYHRLKVFNLHVPPLRERLADLPALVEHFRRSMKSQASRPLRITPQAWAALRGYSFPGNIRELKHIVEHALVLSAGQEIDVEHLPDEVRGERRRTIVSSEVRPWADVMAEFERDYLVSALEKNRWRRAQTARILGMSRKTLWQKMRDHGISERPEGAGD
jgi:DNA-binding NtrC family response regulator